MGPKKSIKKLGIESFTLSVGVSSPFSIEKGSGVSVTAFAYSNPRSCSRNKSQETYKTVHNIQEQTIRFIKFYKTKTKTKDLIIQP